MVARVQFKASFNGQHITFCSVSDLDSSQRETLAKRIIDWNCSLQKAAIKSILEKELGKEFADSSMIQVHPIETL
ncbi:hypothetical protein H1S01_03020 [Heliobacterium chlorum]|uniref:Uncharacterized protein n=1 Tax=Heliobacterium chlorum TaxID=2698 RepID=A0ABR7SY68_HELCL|nr:hypothetical protein [Heliobacterium chlorum]MBC9783482.1 hypothetical protein [Heliobacterium chlorum]